MKRIPHIKRLYTLDGTGADKLGLREDVSMTIDDNGMILSIDPAGSSSKSVGIEEMAVAAKSVIPGFIDAHTHTIFAGDRRLEFGKRIAGQSYQQIAESGGGIALTVRATREASRAELLHSASGRLAEMISHGVTTVEIKSGYGLNLQTELAMLEVAAQLTASLPIEVVSTFLGAHIVPPEYRGRGDAYVNLLVQDILPEVSSRKLAKFCDVFCEQGAFTVAQSRRILEAAAACGLGLKLHAEQFTAQGAAELGIALGATSIDHLECLTASAIDLLAKSSTVAVLLPGTAFYLGLPHYPPARELLSRGAMVAVATDFNPGSNMCCNLPLTGTIACASMRMQPAETLRAITIHAAHSLGLQSSHGSLQPGKQADLVFLDAVDPDGLFSHYGYNHVLAVMKKGNLVFRAARPELHLPCSTALHSQA